MPLLNIRTHGTPDEWSDERIKFFVGIGSTIIDENTYPIVDGHRDKKGMVLVVDTGDDGPALGTGAETDLGTVE